MVGVSRAFISKIESGKATPTAELENKINKAVQETMNTEGESSDSLTRNKILFAKPVSAPQKSEPSLPNVSDTYDVTSERTSWLDVLSWAWKCSVQMELSFFQELNTLPSEVDFNKDEDEAGVGVKLIGNFSEVYLKLILSSPDIDHKAAHDIKWVIQRWFTKPDVVLRTDSGEGGTFSWVWFSPDASWMEKVKFVQSQAKEQKILDMEESLKDAWDRFEAFHRGRSTVDPAM